MKTTELRIGNYITTEYLNKSTFKVISIHSDRIYFESVRENFKSDTIQNYIKPIQLTEEWLVKFGFEKLTDKSRGFNSNSYTYTKGISFIVHLNDKLLSVNFWQGNEKKYVHELQNLFFALTGEELTI